MPLIARVWPNGEFSISAKKKFKPSVRFSSRFRERKYGYKYLSKCTDPREVEAHYGLTPRVLLDWLAPGYLAAVLEECATLGLSDAPKNHKRKKRGTSGLTGYARKMLRNCAWALARKVQKYDLGMITTTLPPMLPEDEVKAVNAWGEIMRQFTQWLHRRVKAAGGIPWVVGCCEIQESRQSDFGGLPLHSHLLLHTRVGGRYVFSPSDIQSKWKETVLRVSGIEMAYVWDASTRIETVKKSAEHYLAKYISKGVSNPGQLMRESGYEAPKNWWYAVGGMKKAIKGMVRLLSAADSGYLYWLWQNAEYGLVYRYDVAVELSGSSVPVAWVGKLNQKGWNMLRSVWFREAVRPSL